MFLTGSGGGMIADRIGAKFVQEVTAVSLAVEKLHPEVYSVIELGGQDAKIIVFKDDEETGRKKKIPSMNDKCAGGTGAVIDKINAKLKIPTDLLAEQGYHGIKLHKVAGKCGVFAETDINGLQKVGTPPDELMASLFEAIVLQNLSVLTRGHTLRPHVLLLGGPNSFIRGMREAWQANIPTHVAGAQSRRCPMVQNRTNSSRFRRTRSTSPRWARSSSDGPKTIASGATAATTICFTTSTTAARKRRRNPAARVWSSDPEDLPVFKEAYRRKKFTPAVFPAGKHGGRLHRH